MKVKKAAKNLLGAWPMFLVLALFVGIVYANADAEGNMPPLPERALVGQLEQTYRWHGEIGRVLVRKGKLRAAAKVLTGVYVNCPRNTRTWTVAAARLGVCFEMLDEPKASMACFAALGRRSPWVNEVRTSTPGGWRQLRQSTEQAGE